MVRADDDKPLACERSEWLPAEASTRRYARLTRLRHYQLATAVAMVFPKGTEPAEVARIERATRLLAAAGVPVPEIYDSDPARGWILQEDLGDRSLAAAAAEGGADVGPAYREALALLERVRSAGELPTSPRPPLDGVRLLRELELFATAGLGLADGAGEQLRADFGRLVEACLAAPVVLCHRDYHARNLMLQAGRVRVLDHQDALSGPGPYDRVSLAYDPYVEIDDAVRDEFAGDEPGTCAVAVQRLCKALGTYGEKGGAWRAYVPVAARQARRLIGRGGLRLPVLQASLGALAVTSA